MKEGSKNINQLLKAKFDGFQPPPDDSVWIGIKSGLSATPVNPIIKFFTSTYFIAAASLILLISGIIFIPHIINKENPTGQDKTNITTFITDESTAETTEPENEDADALVVPEYEGAHESIKESGEHQGIETIPGANSDNNMALETKLETEEIQVPVLPKSKEILTTKEIEQPDTGDPNTTIPVEVDLATAGETSLQSDPSSLNMHMLKIAALPNFNRPASMAQLSNNRHIVNFGPVKDAGWDIGLLYYPERIWYPEDDIEYKNSSSVELSLRYRFGEMFIQSGLALAFSEDDGQSQIDYQMYELTGTYEDVYDITFDTTGNTMVPVYHTQTIEVYDTLEQVSYSPVSCKYSYIQIPLLFGYEQTFAGRMFYNLKLGPVVAFMIGESVSDIQYPDGNIDVTRVQDQMPDRIKTSWQFMLNAGLGYNISNHFSLAVEPSFKYYVGTGYKSTEMSTKHPYSLGIRGGVIYRF